jgi:ribonuclease HI
MRGHEKEISGFEPYTTNNRMELKAAVEGLRALKYPCEVELYSDSSYLVGAFEKEWIRNWKANGWEKQQQGRGQQQGPVGTAG